MQRAEKIVWGVEGDKCTVGDDVAGGEGDFRVLNSGSDADWAFVDVLPSGLGSIFKNKARRKECLTRYEPTPCPVPCR